MSGSLEKKRSAYPGTVAVDPALQLVSVSPVTIVSRVLCFPPPGGVMSPAVLPTVTRCPSAAGLGVVRGLQLLAAGQTLEALHHMAESHSTTLRQYMIMKSSCRLAQ